MERERAEIDCFSTSKRTQESVEKDPQNLSLSLALLSSTFWWTCWWLINEVPSSTRPSTIILQSNLKWKSARNKWSPRYSIAPRFRRTETNQNWLAVVLRTRAQVPPAFRQCDDAFWSQKLFLVWSFSFDTQAQARLYVKNLPSGIIASARWWRSSSRTVWKEDVI